jgi:hypothetical protein
LDEREVVGHALVVAGLLVAITAATGPVMLTWSLVDHGPFGAPPQTGTMSRAFNFQQGKWSDLRRNK